MVRGKHKKKKKTGTNKYQKTKALSHAKKEGRKENNKGLLMLHGESTRLMIALQLTTDISRPRMRSSGEGWDGLPRQKLQEMAKAMCIRVCVLGRVSWSGNERVRERNPGKKKDGQEIIK